MRAQEIKEEGLASIRKVLTKMVVTSDSLAAGKKQPSQGAGALKPEKCACVKGDSAEEACKCTVNKTEDDELEVGKEIIASIAKANEAKRIVIGIVLQPEVVDAQGDIYSAEVIEEAAYDYLANYNKKTKLGFQHKDFKNWQSRFELVQSYIAPMDLAFGDQLVKAGSWIIAVRVLDAVIWKGITKGLVKGFSIGGRARVKKLVAQGQKEAVKL